MCYDSRIDKLWNKHIVEYSVITINDNCVKFELMSPDHTSNITRVMPMKLKIIPENNDKCKVIINGKDGYQLKQLIYFSTLEHDFHLK